MPGSVAIRSSQPRQPPSSNRRALKRFAGSRVGQDPLDAACGQSVVFSRSSSASCEQAALAATPGALAAKGLATVTLWMSISRWVSQEVGKDRRGVQDGT